MKTLKNVLSRTRELERIDTFRLGTIVKAEIERNRIWIDYKGNPAAKPVLAKLGTPWIGSEELNLFMNRIDAVKIEFINDDPAKPVIRDLFFSINDLKRSEVNPLHKKSIEIDADEIVLNGHKRIVIQSGSARTVYKAEGSQIIQEAEQIESTADVGNRIKGGSVVLN